MSLLRHEKQFQTTLLQKGWFSPKELEMILQKKGENRLDQYLVEQGILSTQAVKEAWKEVQKSRSTNRYKSFGKYDVLETIARGAMGIIYKVRHQDIEKIYALKAIISLGEDPKETLARFYREAKTSAKLRHPYIIQITDFGKTGSQPYLVMEYVEGKTLEEWIEQKHKLSLKEALPFMQKILQGLHYAHTEGVLHRDLKPSNIFITAEGLPKIGDFGLAKDLQAQTQAQLTYDGEILGTPAYMAPEQAAGNTESLDTRADIYSAGVCLYKMLTGRCPFEEDSISYLFYRVITEEAKPPSLWNPTLPKEIDTIVLKALEKSKEKRYPSAIEFEQDLVRFQRGEPLFAKPATSFERIQKWFKRNAKTVILLIGIGMVATFSISYVLWERFQEKKQKIKTLYTQAKNISEPIQKKSLLNSEQDIKQLFDAINFLNIALSLHPGDLQLEQLKIQIGQQLIQYACSLQEYDMAFFVVAELRTIVSLSDAQKDTLENSIFDEKSKTLQKHLQRLDHWVKTLQSSTPSKGEPQDAIFEISKMSEPEILAKLHQYLQEGVHYFLQEKKRESQQEEFYKIIPLMIGRVANPSSHLFVFEALQEIAEKMCSLPLSQRPVAEIQYMSNLARSLAYLRAKNNSAFLHRLRLEMGQGSLFWQSTEDTYQDLAQIDEVSTAPAHSISLLYNRGVARLQEENFEEALQDFTAVIRLDPQCIEAYRNRGIIYLKQKKLSQSLDEFSQEIRIQPTLEGYLNRGVVKTHLQDFNSALEDFQNALQKNVRSADVYYNRAFVYMNMEKYSLAFQDFNKTLECDPNYVKAYMSRGLLKNQLKDQTGAVLDLEESIRRNPQYTEAYVNLATIKIAQSKWDEAIQHLNQAIKINPTFEEAYINRGNAKHSRGDWDGALQDYQTALTLNPNSYQTYNNRANLRTDRKEYTSAIKDLNEAIRINSRYTDAYLNRGGLRSNLGDIKGALEDYSQIIQINPKYLNVYYNRGLLWRHLKEYTLAIEDFDQAIRLAPEDATFYNLRADLLHTSKRYEEAIRDYTQILKRNPTDSSAYTNRGAAKIAQNDLEGAVTDYKTVLQLEPNSTQACLNLGNLLLKMEQTDLAKMTFSRFLKLAPKNTDSQTEKIRTLLLDLLLVQCKEQLQQQNYSKGQQLLQEYLLFAPSNHPDRKRIESLLEQIQKQNQEPK